MTDVALGSWLIIVALMLVTGSAPMYWSFKILFLVRFSHTLFLIGQHTVDNFHLLLTAVRVTNYNMMYGGPNLTRGPPKFGGPGALEF